MSTLTYEKLYQGQLGNSLATVATVASGTYWIIKKAIAVNCDTVNTHTFSIAVDGTADTNRITPPSILLPAGGSWEPDNSTDWMLGPASTVAAGADTANKVTLTLFGIKLVA